MMFPSRSTFRWVTSIVFASCANPFGLYHRAMVRPLPVLTVAIIRRTFGVVGTLDGFGSVIVNGVRYDTSQATFIVNGETATEDQLAVGSGHIDCRHNRSGYLSGFRRYGEF